jgi:putative chitinase
MQITSDQLYVITGRNVTTPLGLDDAIKDMSAPEAAGFVSTLIVESNYFSRLVEDLHYSAEALLRTWPSRFSPALASACAYRPRRITEIVYDNRLGNKLPGDGYRYRGRGYIQITGRDNYRAIGEEISVDLICDPDLLLAPECAMRASVAYWRLHHLDQYCPWRDQPSQPWRELCHAVNGGEHGLDRRREYADMLLRTWCK